jgi:hypothetical protein
MGLLARAGSASGQAQDERDASELFRAAEAAYAAHNYAAAANAFEAAYLRAPRGVTIYNAAVAWESAEEPARAADDFATALRDPNLAVTAATDARTRLAVLEAQLGIVRVTEPSRGSVLVAHVRGAKAPVIVHLRPGQYEVEVQRVDGSVAKKTIAVRAGESVDAAFEAAAPTSQRAAPRPSPLVRPSPAAANTQRALGWIGVGLGAASSGAAIYLGVRTLRARDDYQASGYLDASARADGIALRTWTNVAWGAAVVTGMLGVVLLLTAPGPASEGIGEAATQGDGSVRF